MEASRRDMNSTQSVGFVERRGTRGDQAASTYERRQFGESRDAMDPDVRELAEAIDAFKISQHRRYVTLAEVLGVVKGLGYHK
jgi:hypothetical protein